ncbi:MAG: hypothetical protein AUJ96_10025 [Armatimonadetes bacterium CG2_30_66_41]|nr:MAG: hypothetical protein AUJ96_10025 [Armatimonadetes bacterium CG2_30_66_41]
MASADRQLKLTHNLLRLDDGRELVLANTRKGGLLYFAAGREFVLSVLDRAGNHGVTEGVTESTEKGGVGNGSLDGAGDGSPDRPPHLTDRSPDPAGDEHTLLQALKAHRLLVPAGSPEHPEIPAQQDLTAPKERSTLHLFLTGRNGDGDMPQEVAHAAIARTLRGMSANGACEVVFLGLGEDEARWQAAGEAMSFAEAHCGKAKKRSPGYVLATSAAQLPPSVVEQCRGANASPRFAFDWPVPVLTSEPAQRTLAELAKRDIPVTVRLSVGEQDLQAGDWALSLVRDLPPATSVQLLPQLPSDPVAEVPNPTAFADLLLRAHAASGAAFERVEPTAGIVNRLVHGGSGWYCGMPFGTAVAIDSTGNAHPCYGLCGDGHCLGTAHDPGAAYAKSFVLNRLLYKTHVSNLPECADCQWRHLCAGGCPAMALEHRSRARQRVDSDRDAASTPSAGAATALAGAATASTAAATEDLDYRQWWCQMCQELLPQLTWHVARQLFRDHGGAPDKADTNDRIAGCHPGVRPLLTEKGGTRSCGNCSDPIWAQ